MKFLRQHREEKPTKTSSKATTPKTPRQETTGPRKRFRDSQRQMMYENALQNHEILLREVSGNGNAYRMGYEGREEMKETWTVYPIFCAGRDNLRSGK